MKKSLILITVLMLVTAVFVGCSKFDDKSVPSMSDKLASGTEMEEQLGMYADSIYMTFEELTNKATDIVKGKCVDVHTYDSYFEYEFEVVDRYLGENVNTNIFVYVPSRTVGVLEKELSYELNDISYDIGNEYYLILSRRVDVYLDHDRYMNVGANIFLPASDYSSWTMYGETIENHTTIENLNSDKILINYFNGIKSTKTRDNVAMYDGFSYITTDAISSIISNSEHVLKVTINNEVHKGIAQDRNTFDCLVTATLKGDVTVNSTVRIVFPKDSVTEGTQCIVALSEIENVTPRTFLFSSKNSLFSVDEINIVMSYIENVKE